MANPEYRKKHLDLQSKWAKANPEKCRKNGKRWRDKKRVESPGLLLSRERRRKYGVTEDEIGKLTEIQRGMCAVCQRQTSDFRLDHCHSSGNVRGLLCHNCNAGIGMLGDTVEGLQRALAYLQSPPFLQIGRAKT
jgi:hypothetical protein